MSNKQFDAKSTGSTTPKNTGTPAQSSGQDDKGKVDAAKDQAQEIAGKAKGQAQDLLHSARSEASSQLSSQQQRLAGSLSTLSSELDTMAQNSPGVAAGLVSQAAEQVHNLAGWLENREPAELLDEATRYARRHPGAFLAGAALLGLLGGRMTRGLQADASRNETTTYGQDARAYGYASTTRTGYTQGYETTGQAGVTPSTGVYGQAGTGERFDTDVPTGGQQDFLTGDQRTAEARTDVHQPGSGDLYR